METVLTSQKWYIFPQVAECLVLFVLPLPRIGTIICVSVYVKYALPCWSPARAATHQRTDECTYS